MSQSFDFWLDVETVAGGGTIDAGTDFALVNTGSGVTVTMPAASAGKFGGHGFERGESCGSSFDKCRPRKGKSRRGRFE